MISGQFTRYPHLTPMYPPRITQLNYELISLHQSSPPPLTSPPRPSPFQIQSHPFPISWPRTRAWGHPGAKGLMLGHDGQGSDKQQQQLRLYRYQVVPYHTCSIDTRAQVVGMWPMCGTTIVGFVFASFDLFVVALPFRFRYRLFHERVEIEKASSVADGAWDQRTFWCDETLLNVFNISAG